MLDTTILTVMRGAVIAPDSEDISPGEVPTLVLNLVSGLVLPLADPNNPTKPIIVPSHAFNFRLPGDSAVAIGNELVAKGTALPKPSRVAVASSLAGADQVARQLSDLRGGD